MKLIIYNFFFHSFYPYSVIGREDFVFSFAMGNVERGGFLSIVRKIYILIELDSTLINQ